MGDGGSDGLMRTRRLAFDVGGWLPTLPRACMSRNGLFVTIYRFIPGANRRRIGAKRRCVLGRIGGSELRFCICDLLILALELSDTLILADSVCPLSRAVMEIRIYIFDPIGPTN